MAGCWIPVDCSLQPAKYVRGLGQAAERAGARLVENTEVTRVRRVRGGFEVEHGGARPRPGSPGGHQRLHPAALGRLRRRVIPIGSYIIATRPLDDELARQLVPRGRVISDTKNLLYYFRLSPDGQDGLWGPRIVHPGQHQTERRDPGGRHAGGVSRAGRSHHRIRLVG